MEKSWKILSDRELSIAMTDYWRVLLVYNKPILLCVISTFFHFVHVSGIAWSLKTCETFLPATQPQVGTHPTAKKLFCRATIFVRKKSVWAGVIFAMCHFLLPKKVTRSVHSSPFKSGSPPTGSLTHESTLRSSIGVTNCERGCEVWKQDAKTIRSFGSIWAFCDN